MAVMGFVRDGDGDAGDGVADESPVAVAAPSMLLDASQRAVIDLPLDTQALVLGAPGTGKTATAIELLADRVERHGYTPDECLIVAPSRAAATRLRGQIARRLARATNGPLARTIASLAFEIVRHAAARSDGPEPVLLTGGDQDQIIRELLEGHLIDGGGPPWPSHLNPDVRALRGFRTELRELLMRMAEHGVSPARLRDLGVQSARAEWVAAAEFAAEYHDVVDAARAGAVDAAELLATAAAAVERGWMPPRIAALRLLIIDDLQEATESALRLILALHGAGVPVVAFGEPDVAAGAFRGASGGAVSGFAIRASVADPLTLAIAHRQGPALRAFTESVTARIGAGAVSPQRRRATAGRSDEAAEPIVVFEESSAARELAAIARRLREHHLIDGVPLAGMVVVVRSGAQVPAYARGLALADVPTRTTAAAQPLRDATAARALLTIVDVGIGRRELTPALAAELLLGPFGGFDRLALRRLRLALRAEELAGGGMRQADELLVEALVAPGRFATIDDRVGRLAARLAGALAAVGERERAGATIEELLWLVWERSGLADVWRSQALGAGVASAEADRNLDAVLALFTAARRFVERRPGFAAAEFLAALLDAEVPEDTLAPQQMHDTVLVTTPAGLIGAEHEVVVVAGLQDGAWPNLRVRGTLLHLDDLAAAAAGTTGAPVDARRQVLHDELRLFALAITRARRQVILSAVVNDDAAGSLFLALVPPDLRGTRDGARRSNPVPLSLRGLTGRLRRTLTSTDVSERERSNAAAALARLAEERVPGAAPAEWQGLLPVSTEVALFDGADHVPVSPSRIDAVIESPFDWFIDTVAGSEPGLAMTIGTIVHWAMETGADDPRPEALWARVEQRMDELVFEAPWLAQTERGRMRTMITGVAEYLADFAHEGKTALALEGRFRLEAGRARLSGSIDRIEVAPDGSVEIADLKTGTPITSQRQIDEHPQLRAYQLAYAEGHFDELLAGRSHRAGGAKLVYVRKGLRGKAYQERVQAPLDEAAIAEFRALLIEVAELMAGPRFTAPVEFGRAGQPSHARARLHRVHEVSSDGATGAPA